MRPLSNYGVNLFLIMPSKILISDYRAHDEPTARQNVLFEIERMQEVLLLRAKVVDLYRVRTDPTASNVFLLTALSDRVSWKLREVNPIRR